MAVAHRHDGVGQHGFGQHFPGMTPPSSFNTFGYDRRPKIEEPAEPAWPVPRLPHQPPQAVDRSTDVGGLSNGFSQQPDLTRQQAHPANYTYDGSSSALRNPVVYSQPAQPPWAIASHSSTDYAEYPTASFLGSVGQRAQPSMHSQAPYLSSANGAYGDPSLASGSDAYSKSMSGPYDHTAETLWPLGPNSLDAFAGMPAPTGQVARLTLTSAADRNRYKARSSLPPPKQFKCSACDAIFSRNHDLKRHARIHLAVKPFPCGYCDKAFSRKDALKRHVLVKGCGIGNKKSSDNRKRAATLSKLEHSEGGSTNRAPYDGAPSRDFCNFRDDLHYQGQQQHQGFQSEGSSTRSFAGRMDAPWPDAANPGLNADYASSRVATTDERGHASHGLQMPSQTNLVSSYGSQPQSQPYSNLGMGGDDAFSQPQRPQLAGGLVNAFTSPEANSASSPTDLHNRSALGGSVGSSNGDALDVKVDVKSMSRPGSAKLSPNSASYGAQPFPVAGGDAVGLGNEPSNGFGGAFEADVNSRFSAGSYPLAPMMSPSRGGPDPDSGNPHMLKRGLQQQQQQQQQHQQQQQPFTSYFGNNASG